MESNNTAIRAQAIKVASTRQRKVILDGEAAGKDFVFRAATLWGCLSGLHKCPGVSVIDRERVHVVVCDCPHHYKEAQ